jgi:hypothetical protein
MQGLEQVRVTGYAWRTSPVAAHRTDSLPSRFFCMFPFSDVSQQTAQATTSSRVAQSTGLSWDMIMQADAALPDDYLLGNANPSVASRQATIVCEADEPQRIGCSLGLVPAVGEGRSTGSWHANY